MAKEMIKRKDGSYSQRGLWDNIRANKGSGKKPTAQMLKQEKKIKAESKKMNYGGMADRYMNPKSASMMRYGGMKKAQMGTTQDSTMAPKKRGEYASSIITAAQSPSRNQIQKTFIKETGKSKRAEERTDRKAYVQPEKTKRAEIRQTQKTARQVSRDDRKVKVAMTKAGMNPMGNKKKGGPIPGKNGKKK